jgi:peptide/nickel transport system substrate-binding protein
MGNRKHLLFSSALTLGLFASFGAMAQERFSCPQQGGDLVVGLEAAAGTLDQQTATSSATRNIAMNIFEALIIRDENMRPVPDLADSIETGADGLTYTFKLRQGVKFHNGKPMTSADVLASFERYKTVGVSRSILEAVAGWTAPDDATFVITLKAPQPNFLENLSSSTAPVVIMPAEEAGKAAGQIDVIGTGPFKLGEFVPDSHVRLDRYADYTPGTTLSGLSGFAGYKQACVDTVTFRMLTETAARMAALETGEVHIVESVPAISMERLAAVDGVELLTLDAYGLNIGYPNWSAPPTDNIKVRQAMLAALNMDEIMEASTDGVYKLNPSLQFPGTAYFSEAGGELYNQANAEKAKALLAEAGYNNEPIVLLTTQQITTMYNTALVMQAQLQAAGFNAELKVFDWPTALATSEKETTGWNFFFTHWTGSAAQGGATTLRNLAAPANIYKPQDPAGDPDYNAAFQRVQGGATIEERAAAFADAQKAVFEHVLAIPFGVMSNVQGTRSNVKGFTPFYNTRVSNVWLEP